MSGTWKKSEILLPKKAVEQFLETMIWELDRSPYSYGNCNGLKVFDQKTYEEIKKTAKKEKEEVKNVLESFLHRNVRKYSLGAVIGETVGYFCYNLSLELTTKKAPYYIETKGFSKQFKNLTELKNYLKTTHKQLFGCTVYCNDKKLGRIKIGEICKKGHVYKKKPRTIPKKYRFEDEYVRVYLGAVVPDPYDMEWEY